ncbi:MAG: MFS transporter [Haloferacaceae archaeon]
MSVESLVGENGDIVYERRFQALIAANLLAPLGITLVSPLLDTLSGPFGVSTARMGLLISAYTAPPIFLIPVAGILADRVGRKPVLLGGIILFGVGGTAITLTTEFWVAVALRLVQGVAFAGLTTIIITSIGDVYVESREATAQGLRFTSSGVYQTIFPPVAGALVVVAWWAPFLIYAMAFPVAVLVYLWFEEPLDDPTVTEGSSGSGGIRSLLALVSRPRVLSLVAGRALPMLPWVGFLTYNSLIVARGVGGSPAEAGILVAVNSTGLAVGGSQAGRITERFDSRLWPLALANVALGAGLVLVAFASTLAVGMVGAAVLGLGFGVSLSLYRSVVTGLAPAHLRGGLVSVSESGGRVASTLTPLAMGAVVTATTPALGPLGAVRLAAVGTGALAVVGGTLVLVVARLTRPTAAGG